MEEREIEAVGNKLISALSGSPVEQEKPLIKMPEPKNKEEAKKEEPAKGSLDLDDISRMLGVK